MRREKGFTLIELMIVVSIIAIIAAIAIPNLLSARVTSNETATIATLRNISSAQAQFQALSKADSDYDGMGEFGAFVELSGFAVVRAGLASEAGMLNPPVLSGAFRVINADGEVERSGYQFKMYLPDSGGLGISPDESGTYADVDMDLAETTWVCYAWPSAYGNSGTRAFMVNQTGDIVTTEFNGYDGSGGGPVPGAAFLAGAAVNSITGLTAIGVAGRDGHVWKQVN